MKLRLQRVRQDRSRRFRSQREYHKTFGFWQRTYEYAQILPCRTPPEDSPNRENRFLLRSFHEASYEQPLRRVGSPLTPFRKGM